MQTKGAFVAFGAVAVLAAGCIRFENGKSGAEVSWDAVKIAALTDRTGTSATLAYIAAIKLAFKQMNEGLASSTQASVQFALLSRDTASRAEQAAASAREVVLRDGAKALITEISADTIAVNALNYGESPLGVPVNCFACSSSFINNPAAVDADPGKQTSERDEKNYLHRLFMNSKYEAAVQMRVAMSHGDQGDANGDGNFKVALIATNDPYGKGWESALRMKMQEMHPEHSSIEVMYVDPKVNDTSYNWNTDLSKLVDQRNDTLNVDDGKPDVIFLALLPVGSGAAAKAYREAGYDIPLQATTSFRRLHILRALGTSAEGVEGGSPRAASGDFGMAFEAAFKAEYGEDPEMLSAGAYDCAVTHMLAALVAIGTRSDGFLATSDGIRMALDRINDPMGVVVGVGPQQFALAADTIKAGRTINYQGATGDTTFDKNGDTHPVLVHYRVENKQFKELESYLCTESNPLCMRAP
jgi:ABC-type branched-subunit amino acid transport system substrate-binding protein